MISIIEFLNLPQYKMRMVIWKDWVKLKKKVRSVIINVSLAQFKNLQTV